MVEPQEDRGRDRILGAARQLFGSSGFHQSPMSELASVAKVSVGQIYRLFNGKYDIIAAIVDEDMRLRLDAMHEILDDAETRRISVEEAFRRLVLGSLSSRDEALTFEILAEAHRNSSIAQGIARFCDDYRSILGRLAYIANPAMGEAQRDAAEELLLACLFGLGQRSLSKPTLPDDRTANDVSIMMMAALGCLSETESPASVEAACA